MENITQYIKPELLLLIPVLYFIGRYIKSTKIDNKHIPLILGIGSIILSAIWILATEAISGYQDVLMAVFTAFVQGILCAGSAVYCNELIVQNKRDN